MLLATRLPPALIAHRARRRLAGAMLLATRLPPAEPPTEPGAGIAPACAIRDGARGGSDGCYFLPPMVPAPSYSGAIDGAQIARRRDVW